MKNFQIFVLILVACIEVLACNLELSVSKKGESAIQKENSLKALSKNYFKLGCGLTGRSESTNAINLPDYMSLVDEHFSSCTMTNLMKPDSILSQSKSKAAYTANDNDETTAPVLDFSIIASTLEWCKNHNVQMRGHTLVWHKQAPEWFFRSGYESNGELVSKAVMIERLDSFIKQYMSYVQDNYPGVIYCWDVVNEAVDESTSSNTAYGDDSTAFRCRRYSEDHETPNLWYSTLGPDFPEIAFTIARKYASEGVSLFYNDYNAVYYNKRPYVYALCESLKEKGLIDGIGIQAYWGVDSSSPTEATIEYAINYYSQLGLEIQITEWSMDADTNKDGTCSEEELSSQAQRYADLLNLLQNLDTYGGGKANITCVSFFGVVDNYPLYDNNTDAARLFYSNYEPKPVFYSVQNVLKNNYK